jgi:hypothetical protein
MPIHALTLLRNRKRERERERERLKMCLCLTQRNEREVEWRIILSEKRIKRKRERKKERMHLYFERKFSNTFEKAEGRRREGGREGEGRNDEKVRLTRKTKTSLPFLQVCPRIGKYFRKYFGFTYFPSQQFVLLAKIQ